MLHRPGSFQSAAAHRVAYKAINIDGIVFSPQSVAGLPQVTADRGEDKNGAYLSEILQYILKIWTNILTYIRPNL